MQKSRFGAQLWQPKPLSTGSLTLWIATSVAHLTGQVKRSGTEILSSEQMYRVGARRRGLGCCVQPVSSRSLAVPGLWGASRGSRPGVAVRGRALKHPAGASTRNRMPWACGKPVFFGLRSAELAPDTYTAAWSGPVTVCRGETPRGCLLPEARVPPTPGPATDPESKPRSQRPAVGRERPPSQHRRAGRRGWRVRGRGPVGWGCSPARSRAALVSRAGPGPRGRPGSVRARRGRL